MAQANQYFAPSIDVSGRMQRTMAAGQEYDIRNKLAEQQGILFQQAQQDRAKSQQNDQLFKNALVQFLGPVNAGIVTGDASVSPQQSAVPATPSAAPAPGMGASPPQGQPQAQGMDQNSLLQMMQANPERAAQFVQFQQQQQQNAMALRQAQVAAQQAAVQKQANEKLLQATYYLKSENPAATIRIADPIAYQGMVDHGVDMDDPGAVKQALRAVQSHFGPIAGITPEKAAEGFTLNQGEQRFDAEGKRIASVAPKTTSQEIGDLGLTPEDIDVAAGVVMLDPTRMHDYATFGKTGQAIRTAINKAITKKLTDANMTTGGLAKLRQNFVAQKGSIKKMTEQANNIETFEGLAKYNGQRVLDLIDKIDDTGVPFIEGITRKLKKGAGSVDAAEAQSVLTAFQTEAARILNNPNLTGVLSDSARHEVQDMIGGNLSAAQTKRVINRIFAEMDVRKQLINQQIGSASGSMAGEAPIAGATETPPAAGGNYPPDIAALIDKHGNK